MDDTPKKPLTEYTDDELSAELARRRAATLPQPDSLTFEEALIARADRDSAEAFDAFLCQHERAQTTDKQPCPRCGTLCRVRRASVERTVRTLSLIHI